MVRRLRDVVVTICDFGWDWLWLLASLPYLVHVFLWAVIGLIAAFALRSALETFFRRK